MLGYGYSANFSAAPAAGVVVSGPALDTVNKARLMEQQSRFAAGKTFFRNGDKWIDSDVQKKTDAKRVRVQFGTQEYFDLLAKNPQAKSWLALGTNVEFTLGDTIYEVTE